MQIDAGDGDRAADAEQQQADGDDGQPTEARDHVAGEEARREHRDDVPEHDVGGMDRT
jgi:hypothetical protein